MDDSVKLFAEEFNELTADCQKFCFMARDREFQVEGCQTLGRLKARANKLKAEVIADDDEASANLMLSFEEILDALINELRMCIALKDDDPNSAWNYLISAQSAARTALQAHPAANHLEHYVHRLHALERLLFPPQFFVSTGIVIERAECSICREEYGECNHLRGKAYRGQMCVRVITAVKQLKEVSLVDEPSNKRCRILQSSHEGITRDLMSWRIISDSPDGA